MIVRDCAEFERELAELLASPGGAPADPARARALGEHAAACPACAPSSALIGWASRPAGERELESAPPAGYWETFDARLDARIASASRARSRGTLIRSAAAAAAIVAVGLAAGLLVRRSDVAAGPAAGPALPVEALAAAADSGDDAWSQVLPEPEPAGFSSSDAEPFFPAVEDLDEAGRRGLVDWLRAEQARLNGGDV